VCVYYYISGTVSRQYARAFLSSPSTDAGLIRPSVAAQHQRVPRARVQYTPRARMGNRVWFLNKYCRKPFSMRTRSSRFHRVVLLLPTKSRIYSTPTPPLSTPHPQPIAPQSTQRDIYYIPRTLCQCCTLRGMCIHIIYTYAPCVYNGVVVCVCIIRQALTPPPLDIYTCLFKTSANYVYYIF